MHNAAPAATCKQCQPQNTVSFSTYATTSSGPFVIFLFVMSRCVFLLRLVLISFPPWLSLLICLCFPLLYLHPLSPLVFLAGTVVLLSSVTSARMGQILQWSRLHLAHTLRRGLNKRDMAERGRQSNTLVETLSIY